MRPFFRKPEKKNTLQQVPNFRDNMLNLVKMVVQVGIQY